MLPWNRSESNTHHLTSQLPDSIQELIEYMLNKDHFRITLDNLQFDLEAVSLDLRTLQRRHRKQIVTDHRNSFSKADQTSDSDGGSVEMHCPSSRSFYA